MHKFIRSAVAALLVAGGLSLGAALPAAATEDTATCVPKDAWVETINHAAVGEPTKTIPNPDYVPATDPVTVSTWWNWSPNKDQGPFDGPPGFPVDERGTWQGPHTEGGPGQDRTGTYQQGEGNGSWFHRETVTTPGKPAVGEPTLTVPNPDYVPARTETINHPAVVCPPEDPDLLVITPLAPTFTDLCGTANDTIDLPDQENVVFDVSENEDGSVTVTATPLGEEVVFAEDVETSWTYTFSDEACPVAVVPPVEEPTVVVEKPAPVVVAPVKAVAPVQEYTELAETGSAVTTAPWLILGSLTVAAGAALSLWTFLRRREGTPE